MLKVISIETESTKKYYLLFNVEWRDANS